MSFAKYKPLEVLYLQYGDSDKDLYITEPVYDPVSPPQDSVILIPANSPDLAVVDMKDNFIFGTTSSATIQAFDKSGNQILVLFYSSPYIDDSDSMVLDSIGGGSVATTAQAEIGTPFKCEGLANICVDSKSRLYIESATDQDYIAVISLDGILLNKIYPPDLGYSVNLQDMTMNSNDILTFVDDFMYDIYTYRNGKLYQGGLAGWLARDGYYYSAIINMETKNIDFTILGDPETPSLANAFRMESRPIQAGAEYCGILGVSDDMRIFVGSNTYDEKDGQLIQVYNSRVELIDQFRLKRNSTNKIELASPLPYFRPDGTIFEFRCSNDGMHLIKWNDDIK